MLVWLMFSCKVVFVNKGKGENLRPNKLYKNLNENCFEFNNLTLKFSAELFSGETSETFSGIIRIQRDSIIWLSLRSYNIEGARVCITQDSVKYLNRIDNTYYPRRFCFSYRQVSDRPRLQNIRVSIVKQFFLLSCARRYCQGDK